MGDIKTVLCVDDEVNVLSALKRVVLDEEFNFLTASSGKEGLAILAETPVHLVISDQRMPEMTGIEFLNTVQELYPDTVRVILSGYADLNTIYEAVSTAGIFRFLSKPWHDEELLLTIRQCFTHYDFLYNQKSLMEQYERENQKLRTMNQQLSVALEEKTFSAQSLQHLFQKIPIPMISISHEGIVGRVSHAIENIPFSLQPITPGINLCSILPTEMAENLARYLANAPEENSLPNILWNNNRVQLRIVTLHNNSDNNGHLIVLEEI